MADFSTRLSNQNNNNNELMLNLRDFFWEPHLIVSRQTLVKSARCEENHVENGPEGTPAAGHILMQDKAPMFL